MSYKAGPIPSENLRETIDFLQRELTKISAEIDILELVEYHVEPTQPFHGLRVIADGVDWNPGFGRGVYWYDSDIPGWVLMGSIASDGEANTASNTGFGQGLFKQKTGVDLEFYSIKTINGLSTSLNNEETELTFSLSLTLVAGTGMQIDQSGDTYTFTNIATYVLDDLTNVDTTGVLTDQTILYNGTSWVAGTPPVKVIGTTTTDPESPGVFGFDAKLDWCNSLNQVAGTIGFLVEPEPTDTERVFAMVNRSHRNDGGIRLYSEDAGGVLTEMARFIPGTGGVRLYDDGDLKFRTQLSGIEVLGSLSGDPALGGSQNGRVTIQNSGGTDDAGEFGFSAGNTELQINNYVQSGHIVMLGQSSGLATRTILRGDPDDETAIYGSGVKNIRIGSSTLGFYNGSPISKPDVSGSRGGNAALADLLTELANLNLITDSTTA